MRRISKFSVPAALALFVVTAHPESPSQNPQNAASTTAQQKQLTREERNQQSTFDPQRVSDTELKKSVTDINKASTFMKMAVQNMQNEKLGTINDLVFDPESGKISYAVLSVGGFLGVGDKLVAVPLTAFRPQPGQDYLVLNMTKDELKSAPGLARNNWPRLNDPAFGSPASSEKSSASSSIEQSSSIETSSEPKSSTTPGDQADTSKSSDKLSSSEKLSTPAESPSSTSSKDAQGSSPSTSTSSEKSSTETSGKDSGATDTSNSSKEQEQDSSTPKS
jgi:hypothetical protein